MKRKLSKFFISSAAAIAWTGACSSDVTTGDSESHFLAFCTPGGCGSGLECLCGVCTKACTSDANCSALGNATCVVRSGCSTPKSCDVPCHTSGDCSSAAGSACVGGYCRSGSVPVVPDSGAGGKGPASPDGGHGDGDASPADASVSDGSTGKAPAFVHWDGGPGDVDGRVTSCWFPGAIVWLPHNLILGPSYELDAAKYTLTVPDLDTHDARSCSAPLPDCGAPGITNATVGAALRDPDVESAFAEAAGRVVSFGDNASAEGTVIEIDGATVNVDFPCNGKPGCRELLPGLVRLRDLLLRIPDQELGLGSCHTKSDCYLPQDPGTCDGAFPRFAYDVAKHQCEPFTYGGCGGNANRFTDADACKAACFFDPCGATWLLDGGGCPQNLVQAEGRCFTDEARACACACAVSGHATATCTSSNGTATCN